MSTNSHDGRERRQHPRIALTRQGRFLASDDTEHPCTIRDISLGGIALLSETSVETGNHVIVYLDDFGRFEGTVVRTYEGGFAIETALTGPRRERIAERLASLARGEEEEASRRIHARYSPAEAGVEEGSVLNLDDGTSNPCRIIDMSLGGAHVATELRPPIGTNVSVGRTKGRIVRHTSEGVAIQFTDIPEDAAARSHPFKRL